jgi:hypothetical protein
VSCDFNWPAAPPHPNSTVLPPPRITAGPQGATPVAGVANNDTAVTRSSAAWPPNASVSDVAGPKGNGAVVPPVITYIQQPPEWWLHPPPWYYQQPLLPHQLDVADTSHATSLASSHTSSQTTSDASDERTDASDSAAAAAAADADGEAQTHSADANDGAADANAGNTDTGSPDADSHTPIAYGDSYGGGGVANSGGAGADGAFGYVHSDAGVGNHVSGDAADAAQDAEDEKEVLEEGAAAGSKLRVIQSILHRLQRASATVHSQPEVLCLRSLYCMQCPT